MTSWEKSEGLVQMSILTRSHRREENKEAMKLNGFSDFSPISKYRWGSILGNTLANSPGTKPYMIFSNLVPRACDPREGT